MRVFVTGATGYIGSAVVDAVLRGGHEVMGLVRSGEKAARLEDRGAMALIGDLATPETYADRAATCDAIVHAALDDSPKTAGIDGEAIDAMLGALARRTDDRSRTFVYTSGVWVIGNTADAVGEDVALDHPAALSAWRVAHEARVLDAAAHGLRTAVIRPGVVFGGARGIVSDLVKDGLNGLIRVIGPGTNRWALVYDRDLADLYLRVLQSPEAAGIFHATTDSDERVADIAAALQDHMSARPDVRFVPMAEARAKLGDYADALALDQSIRSPRARRLGWTPSLRSVAGSVPRLLEEFRAARNL